QSVLARPRGAAAGAAACLVRGPQSHQRPDARRARLPAPGPLVLHHRVVGLLRALSIDSVSAQTYSSRRPQACQGRGCKALAAPQLWGGTSSVATTGTRREGTGGG